MFFSNIVIDASNHYFKKDFTTYGCIQNLKAPTESLEIMLEGLYSYKIEGEGDKVCTTALLTLKTRYSLALPKKNYFSKIL